MKKVLSLLLAVVLVFSMATVAFAAGSEKTCKICDFKTLDAAEYDAHMLAKDCGRCNYCNNGFATSAELNSHTYVCLDANVLCDYCGKTYPSHAEFDAHIEACKDKYFNIPLAKIISIIKDLISKIDFNAIVGTVKDLAGKVVPVVTDLFGKIDFSKIKLPA